MIFNGFKVLKLVSIRAFLRFPRWALLGAALFLAVVALAALREPGARRLSEQGARPRCSLFFGRIQRYSLYLTKLW